MDLDIPPEYLIPGQSLELPDDHVKTNYANISMKDRAKLQKFYQFDLDFFQYTIDINTLEITY